MWNLIVAAVVGSLTSIGANVLIEYLRRPKLKLFAERPPYDLPYPDNRLTQMRALRVKLFNKPLGRWVAVIRAPALQCRATITFHHKDGKDVFGRSMDGRWAGSPEPTASPILDSEGKHQFSLIDFTRLTVVSRIDLYPGETEILDIAVRVGDDDECYGWNNETYFSTPRWRNPDWKLKSGQYLVTVAVVSSGQKCVGYFRLVNDVSRADFRLEPATQSEIELLSAQ